MRDRTTHVVPLMRKWIVKRAMIEKYAELAFFDPQRAAINDIYALFYKVAYERERNFETTVKVACCFI